MRRARHRIPVWPPSTSCGPAPRRSSRASRRCAGGFDLATKRTRIEDIDKQSIAPGFWEDNQAAQTLLKERTQLGAEIERMEMPGRSLADVLEMIALAETEGDASFESDLTRSLDELDATLETLEFSRMMSEPNDPNQAILVINAGAGGTESCDWAQMLTRMYVRWAERHRFAVSETDLLPGDEAGVKNVTLSIEGEYAYGYLKAEAGVHRLVRISPFDAAKRRHTSFASVFVYPDIPDDIVINIAETDLRIDTYRAGGAGGQHVNKTDSAVRLTHLPTGLVVACQNERSQHKNKSKALKILAARLMDYEEKKRQSERDAQESLKQEITFGSQIRSYVLAPYRLVKDHRTGFEMGNADAALDGDLDGFIRAFLLDGECKAKGT